MTGASGSAIALNRGQGDVLPGVRREDLRRVAEASLIWGRMTVHEPPGLGTLIYVETAAGEIIAKADSRTPPAVGEVVRLGAAARDVHRFDRGTGAALTWKQVAERSGVLCVGRICCDLVIIGPPRLPTVGTEAFADRLTLHAGGAAAITAADRAAPGRTAFLWKHLPGAPFDAPVAAELARHGIDTRFCGPGEGPRVTVAMAGAGDRAFLTRRTGATCPPLDTVRIAAADIGHLHIGELRSLPKRASLRRTPRAAGPSISFDCGREDAQAAAGDPVAAVDVFPPNAGKAAQLADLGPPERPAPVTVIKRGAKGACRMTADLHLDAPLRPARAVDTSGAGDAFDGGSMQAWLADRAAVDALALAIASGAQAVGAVGGKTGAAGHDLVTAAR